MNAKCHADVMDFPFVEDMPKRSVNRIHTAFDELMRISELVKEKGLPVSVTFTAKTLGISFQRVYQLLDAGILERMEWDGHTYVTQESIIRRLKSEKVVGRPRKEASSK